MGTTFENFFAKHADPQDVWSAATGAGASNFLMEEVAEGGWIGSYLRRRPPDVRAIAREVSAALESLTLYFNVYDSDVCTIALFRNGKRVTEFVSEWYDAPGEAQPGDAARFAKYASQDATHIREILDAEESGAEVYAVRIGECFGIRRQRIVCEESYFQVRTEPRYNPFTKKMEPPPPARHQTDETGRVRLSAESPWLRRV